MTGGAGRNPNAIRTSIGHSPKFLITKLHAKPYRCGMQPTSYSDVSIVIMDLKGFTELSSTMTANDLV